MLVVLLAVYGDCKKGAANFHDLSGDSTIRGTVVLYDTLTGPFNYYGVHPLTVYLGYPGDTTSYLYSTVTNGLGQFSFNGIDQTQAYLVYARMDSMQIHFYGQILYSANNPALFASDTLALYPSQTNQNGIFYHLLDTLGGPLPGCSFFIFSSRELWANNDSIGADYTLKADSYGRCLQMNVNPGEYFVRAMGTYAGLAVDSIDSVTVPQVNIISRSLTLRAVPNNSKLIYHLQDASGDPLPYTDVYIFNSQVLWNNSDSSGAAYFVVSDSTGTAKVANIVPGNYYVHALNFTGPDTLKAVDNFTVPATTTVTRSLQLQ